VKRYEKNFGTIKIQKEKKEKEKLEKTESTTRYIG
jgi:hypothetical protein